MNYYPFHVGDYAAHTAHLEPMEDLAYRRLLDAYYLREGPLPADIEVTAKIIRMRSAKADVESVLREFFTLTDDGWAHKRCDDEIARMREKQAKARASAQASVNARRAKAEQASKASAERTLNETQTNAERTLAEERTDVELPTPTPTPTPTIEIPLHPPSPLVDPAPARGDDEVPKVPADWLEVFHDEHGVDIDHRSTHDRKKFWPLAQAWCKAGVTVGQMRLAVQRAHADAKGPIAYLPAYADRVLATCQAPPRGGTGETAYQRTQREIVAGLAPGVARRAPTDIPMTIDLEVPHVAAIASH